MHALAFAVAALSQASMAPNDTLLRHVDEAHLKNIRQLTFAGQNAEAYWNLDGTKIIYQTTQDGFVDEQIFVMNWDGTDKRMVSSGKGRHTCGYFVPNSDDVVFSATDWKDPGPGMKADMSQGYVWVVNPWFRIFRMNLLTGERRMISHGEGYHAETTIAPDGSFMVYTSNKDGDLEIYRSNLDGTNEVRLTHEVGYDGGPFVSWDGKYIVYRRAALSSEAEIREYKELLAKHMVRPGKLEIWIMDADGSNKRQVTNLGAASFAPFLHPDNKRIIFSSNYGDPAGREFDLWMINVDGTGLRRITATPEFDGFPMFTRDGKRLVWASNRNGAKKGDTNIFVCDWVDDPPAAEPDESGRRVRVGLIPEYGDDGPGLLLSGVSENSPAERGGLRGGDRIMKWGETKINSIEDIQEIFMNAEPSRPYEVLVLRDGKEVKLVIVPERIR